MTKRFRCKCGFRDHDTDEPFGVSVRKGLKEYTSGPICLECYLEHLEIYCGVEDVEDPPVELDSEPLDEETLDILKRS